MIKWKDSYCIGVHEIDEQHKNLFQYLTDLEDVVQTGDVSRALLIKTLDFLEDYAKFHFGNEETCMHKYQCPIAQTNKQAHRAFIELYEEYKGRLKTEAASSQLFNELLKTCEDWLVQHICKIDVQLKPCVHD